jgi:hypothetical protein
VFGGFSFVFVSPTYLCHHVHFTSPLPRHRVHKTSSVSSGHLQKACTTGATYMIFWFLHPYYKCVSWSSSFHLLDWPDRRYFVTVLILSFEHTPMPFSLIPTPVNAFLICTHSLYYVFFDFGLSFWNQSDSNRVSLIYHRGGCTCRRFGFILTPV